MCISSSFFSLSLFLYFFFVFNYNVINIAIWREIVVETVYSESKKCIDTLMYAYFSTFTLLKFIWQYCIFSVNTEICCDNSKHMSTTSKRNKCSCILWIKEKYIFQCTRKIESNRKENNSVLHLMKGKIEKCLVHSFSKYS